MKAKGAERTGYWIAVDNDHDYRVLHTARAIRKIFPRPLLDMSKTEWPVARMTDFTKAFVACKTLLYRKIRMQKPAEMRSEKEKLFNVMSKVYIR